MVIGNGMSGARVVEEILARGGAEQFKITMFGDEPYGNYNRIMLSHVLSGEEHHDDIFLNSFEWYAENGIDLHAPVRVNRIDRFAHVVFSDDGQITPYDQLIIATGSHSFMPPMEGMYDGPSTAQGASCCPACSRSAPSTTPGPWSTTPRTMTTTRRWSSAAACSVWRRRAGCRVTASASTWCTPAST